MCFNGQLGGPCSEFGADDPSFTNDAVGNDTASSIFVPSARRAALFKDETTTGPATTTGRERSTSVRRWATTRPRRSGSAGAARLRPRPRPRRPKPTCDRLRSPTTRRLRSWDAASTSIRVSRTLEVWIPAASTSSGLSMDGRSAPTAATPACRPARRCSTATASSPGASTLPGHIP